MKYILSLLSIIFLFSCKSQKNSYSYDEVYDQDIPSESLGPDDIETEPSTPSIFYFNVINYDLWAYRYPHYRKYWFYNTQNTYNYWPDYNYYNWIYPQYNQWYINYNWYYWGPFSYNYYSNYWYNNWYYNNWYNGFYYNNYFYNNRPSHFGPRFNISSHRKENRKPEERPSKKPKDSRELQPYIRNNSDTKPIKDNSYKPNTDLKPKPQNRPNNSGVKESPKKPSQDKIPAQNPNIVSKRPAPTKPQTPVRTKPQTPKK